MAHYSEMDFLFSKDNRESIIKQTQNDDNTRNIFNTDRSNNSYVVYKSKIGTKVEGTFDNPVVSNDYSTTNTQGIKNYLKNSVYNDTTTYKNPYIKLIETFNTTNGTPGAGLRIKASDLAYLRELGVYPINRMAILRRFPEGAFVPENLDEMRLEPISTVIGWIPTDQNFGNISFNESWGVTNKRFDVLLSEIINKNTGGKMDSTLFAPPEFAQGLLFEFYNRAGLTDNGTEDSDWRDQSYELYKDSSTETSKGWGYNNIPVGDPNVLMEGPFRDPAQQNIQSKFTFNVETTYEQKLLGEVDPGSAMLDIIDNLYAMGTSNMKYYWSENSRAIKAAKAAVTNSTDVFAWWVFIKEFFGSFWRGMVDIFSDIKGIIGTTFASLSGVTANSTISTAKEFVKDPLGKIDTALSNDNSVLKKFLDSIMTSTISIYRFEIRGSIELMTGAKESSTPWYLTIGNPFSPWLSTNHIIVKSAEIETSTEMGYQDIPTWIKVKFSCEFSRSLGKQELMRMLNNTYTRTYTNSSKIGASQTSIEKQKEVVSQGTILPGTDSNFSGFDKNALKTRPMADIPPGRSGYYQYSPPNTDTGSINPINTA